MADLGDIVPLGIQVRDADGDLVNAVTVTLVITLPDGTTVTPFVANPPNATGQYIADYLPTVEGRHLIRWFTTDPAAAFTDSFDVRNTASRSIMSLAQAKEHLNMSLDVTRDDEELRLMIEAVTAVVERHRGEIIARRTVTEDNVMGSGSRLALAGHPVISVSAITDHRNVSMPLDDWQVDRQNGILTRYGGGYWPSGHVSVTYIAGYESIPANYVLAAKIILAHMWQTQRIQNIGLQPTLGAQSRQNEQIVTPTGSGYAIPHRAIELLGGRPSVII